MEENNDFETYQYAKFVLNKLVCQIFTHSISKSQADALQISYSEQDYYNSFGELDCVFHQYRPDGMHVWEKLGLQKPIVLVKDLWDMRKEGENFDSLKDYHKLALEYKLLDAYLVEIYYKKTMDKITVDRLGFFYDTEEDEYDGKVLGYHHMYESAGESAWTLFGLEEFFVCESEFQKIKSQMMEELLLLEESKEHFSGKR